jgi:chromosome segregation ATPase
MSDERTTDRPEPSEIDLLRAEMRAGFQSIGKRFDAVDQRFDAVDQRFDAVDQRFDAVDQRFDAVDRRFEAVDQRFDAVDRRFDAVDQRADKADQRADRADQRADKADQRADKADQRADAGDQRADKTDQRLDGLERSLAVMDARITSEAEATRRHMDVIAENLRADLNVVIDKTTATGEKVDRLIASNAIEHAAFLEALTDHEVRITRLEAASGTSAPTTS